MERSTIEEETVASFPRQVTKIRPTHQDMIYLSDFV